MLPGWLFRLAALVGVLFMAAWPALADDSFFDQGRAQGVLEKVFDKANHPSKILSLEIEPQSLEIDLQDPAQPKHIDAWTVTINTARVVRLVFGAESISGPSPVEPTLANPDLDANLFEFKPADAAIIPQLAEEAIKRARLEDPAGIDRLELRRQVILIPRASSGPPRWTVSVTSGRERAEFYADLPGRITGADFNGTRRAQTLNYLNGGKDLDEVVASIGETLGKGEIIKWLIVYDHSLWFAALEPDHPDGYVNFTAGLNGILEDRTLDPVPVNHSDIPTLPPPGRFSIGDIDWQMLPKLEQAARDRLQLPGGRVGIVKVSKPSTAVGDPAVQWEINIEDGNERGVKGSVVFDAKGNVMHTSYPPGKAPKLDMLDAANIPPAFEALSKALGEHAAITRLEFRNEWLMVTTKDPKNPDERLVYEYRGESLARSIMPPFEWPGFGPGWYFDLAQAQPVAAHWSELAKDALTRLGLPDGKIERVTISKMREAMPRNDRVLIEVRAEVGKRDGRVVYDLSGQVVDIAKP